MRFHFNGPLRRGGLSEVSGFARQHFHASVDELRREMRDAATCEKCLTQRSPTKPIAICLHAEIKSLVALCSFNVIATS